MKLSVPTCDKNNITILSSNCRSIRSLDKRCKLHAVIYDHNADIIIGSESHLDHTYLSSEMLPHNFTAIRKDRIVGGGGVSIAFKNYLALIEQPSLSGEVEMIWAKSQVDNRVTYLYFFYRPPNTDTGPLLHLRESLLKITQIHQSANIILGGDFNYPDILWDDGIGRINTNLAYGNEINTLFLELLNDFGMEQLSYTWFIWR